MVLKNEEFCTVDNLNDTSPGEYMNEALVEDDGCYYNTAEVNTAIRLEDLQRVMSEKSAGENNTFQSEYKVSIIYSIQMQYITISTF